METGIVLGLSNEAYHSGPGLSRSTLWTAYTKTPAHTRKIEEEEADSNALAKGQALDIALLDPLNFELKVMRGPADRRGNKWIEAQAEAANTGRILLTEGVYKSVEVMREIAANHPVIGPIVTRQGVRGASAFAADPDHGVLRKARPDLWLPDANLIVDLKTSRDASPRGFGKSIAEYGYHVQEEWYRSVWQQAGGGTVDAFLFFVVESADPYQIAIYEIDEPSRAKARDIIDQMLPIMKACQTTGFYPGYSQSVQSISLPGWALA